MGFKNIVANCGCGYRAEGIWYGCTMIGLSQNKDYFPVLCNTCGSIAGANIMENPILCPKCFSNDIKRYGAEEMMGELITLDLTSEKFYEDYRLMNKFHIEDCIKQGKNPDPLDIEEFKKDKMYWHKNYQEYEASHPIFSHYNYCPKCKENKLQFFESSMHFD